MHKPPKKAGKLTARTAIQHSDRGRYETENKDNGA